MGQGFIFAILVYFAALVRHQGARYISFYLVRHSSDRFQLEPHPNPFFSSQYCVLFAFQGIYNTIADDPNDIHLWLLAYFQVYAWGAPSSSFFALIWACFELDFTLRSRHSSHYESSGVPRELGKRASRAACQVRPFRRDRCREPY